MPIDRRELLKLGVLGMAALSAGAAAKPSSEATTPAPARASKPLDILILGGTGLTGPHQVRYALARGHRVTIFNRGRKQPEWSSQVEQLLGDREKNDYAALADAVA
jgi:2'-hydroxyisoflavone reductase